MSKRVQFEEIAISATKLKPRILLLAVACAGCWMAVAPAAAIAQASLAGPAFDVATVKPIPPDGRPTQGWIGFQDKPDGVSAASQSLSELLCYAYGYKNLRFDGQVSGVPDWAAKQKYDIEAKMSAADVADSQKLSKDEQQQRREAMMQSLLAERFHLTLHRGSKQVPVYEMVVAKGGIKMMDAATDPAPPQLGKGKDGKPSSTLRWLKDTTVFQAYPMGFFADLLSMPAASVGRPVVDKTGLTGGYNFTLDWSIYSAHAAANVGPATGDPADNPTSIFAALGKIGLKLQPATGSMATIVVDHVEQPTEN